MLVYKELTKSSSLRSYHDIYTKNLPMYIPAFDHCHSALTNYMEWVEDDDNIVRNWKVVWQQ